ncbi:hypothetical protein B1R32_101264 [Abditibacterium utsteinense]|uniref:Cytoplasmic protein n=1 Tax=Abditibacterium utsteinense TaxID=1960156 RepID=A0A2S8SXI8_9BACT|nr:hypothetical protein [Abditibacterium utsteinense]PQV65522.1 hypothetical protein B1R32_101264 [Abditibacterium utsteinense]
MNKKLDLEAAHKHSSLHRAEILGSEICGCFYCRKIFAPDKIVEWIDESKDGVGQTAMCPCCGIDSVIGSASGFPIASEFLSQMRWHWFLN